MTGYFIELRRTPVRWFAAPLFAASLALVFLVGEDWRGSWPETSAAATRAGIPLVIGAVGLAAHRTSQLRRSGVDDLLSARPLPEVEAARLAADATWLSVVYLVSTAVTWVMTAGAPGAPWPEYPLFGVVGIVFAVALGYFAGCLLPSRFTGAAAAVVGFALFALVFDTQSSPLTHSLFHQSIDLRLSSTHLGWRITIAVLAVGAAVTVGQAVTEGLRRRAALMPAAAFCVLTLLAVAVSPGNGSSLQEYRTPSATACASADNGTVCVWPEHERRLPEAMAAVKKMRAVSENVLSLPERYTEDGLNGPGTGGFTLDHGTGALVTSLAAETTNALWPQCAHEGDAMVERRSAAAVKLNAWLDSRARGSRKPPSYDLVGDATGPAEVKRVLALPVPEQTPYVKRWAGALAAPC
ncbi:DUF7224 domain-containing protein [Streptomyces griseolus]|uniref:DUF7224 domain-containing protein n=1 Tax=Streptomyces griseolus TaxID=1909 RepID=UPI002243981E|nr:hypothetical protein [Streptomyces griseolus]MCW8218413.1 hypothetical protein [Streptomyces griseolus]